MNITDRRGFFKSAAILPAIAGAAAIPGIAEAFQSDPIPGWFKEWKQVRAIYEALPDDTDAAYGAWDRARDIEDRILETEATTIAGLAAQAELVMHKDSLLCAFLDVSDFPVFENMRSALNKMQGAA